MARDRFYLSTGPDPKGRGLLAVITCGSPQRGDVDIDVLTLEIVKDQAEAQTWFRRMLIERPWATDLH